MGGGRADLRAKGKEVGVGGDGAGEWDVAASHFLSLSVK